MTLQCVVVFTSADNATVTVQSNLWSRNISGVITTVFPQTPIPNHRLVINSTTGAFTDLVITNVTLEDNNAVYSCSAAGVAITSSVVLNVTSTYVIYVHMYKHVNEHTYVVTYISINFSENLM